MNETRESDGLVWLAEGGDDAIGFAPHEAVFEPLLRQLLPEGGVFLDVGAHVGRWTLRLAGQASKVIAVEANPETAMTLARNLDANRITNVTVVVAAAWDHYEQLGLYDPNAHPRGGSTRCLPGVTDHPQTAGMPLDDLLGREERIDLIKLDVEGADLHALRGMRQTLARLSPVMFIEDHSIHGYYHLADLLAQVEELDYNWSWTPMTYMSARYLVALPRSRDVSGVGHIS